VGNRERVCACARVHSTVEIAAAPRDERRRAPCWEAKRKDPTPPAPPPPRRTEQTDRATERQTEERPPGRIPSAKCQAHPQPAVSRSLLYPMSYVGLSLPLPLSPPPPAPSPQESGIGNGLYLVASSWCSVSYVVCRMNSCCLLHSVCSLVSSL
jgi:hypothetical protein